MREIEIEREREKEREGEREREREWGREKEGGRVFKSREPNSYPTKTEIYTYVFPLYLKALGIGCFK